VRTRSGERAGDQRGGDGADRGGPGAGRLVRYLEIRGDAEITPDDDYSFADRFGAKYQADLRDHDHPGDRRVIVTIRPTRVNAVDMRG
jgi:hypothetical protein